MDHVYQGDTIADNDLHLVLECSDFFLVPPVKALDSPGVQPP